MTSVGILGLLLGLLASFGAFLKPTRLRIAVFVSAYLMHVVSTILYYQLVQGGGGDSALYYYDPGRVYGQGFSANTVFIIYISQIIKTTIGGSYLDHFLIFQSFGFFGIAFLMRIFEEVYAHLNVEQPAYSYMILFLPSVHYWTASIGKDGLFFLAVTMALWGAMNYRKRMVAIVAGMLIMLAIRPHIAVVYLIAFTLAVMIDRSTHPAVRLLLMAAGLGGTAFAAATLFSTFAIDLTDVDTYSDALAGREALVQTESAGRTVVDAPYPLRVLSLLFRPFFFDAPGGLGLVVSIENAVLLLMMLSFAIHGRTTLALIKTVPFARFALASSVATLLVLAIGYYNVGLGIRQKATMILPGLLVAFITLRALLAARRQQAPALELVAANRAVA